MAFFRPVIIIMAALAWAASPVMAQTPAMAAYSAILSQEDQVRGISFQVDDAYGVRTGQAITAPFNIVVPTFGGVGPAFVARMNDNPRNGLVSFGFTTPQGELIEAINLVSAHIPMGEMAQRVEQFAVLLNARTVPQLMTGFDQGARTGIRPITVGSYKAVELLGTYIHPVHGLIQWRLVGIPNPHSPESIYALTGRLLNSLQILK
jgi:hypothetical protein